MSLNKIVKDLFFYVKTARPYFLILIILTAFVLYKSATRSIAIESKEIVYLIIYSLLLSNFIFGINDFYDFEEDKRNERKKNWYSFLFGNQGLSKNERKKVRRNSYVSAILILLLSIIKVNILHTVFTLTTLILTFLYSKYRLKEKVVLFEINTYLSVLSFIASIYFLWSNAFPKIFFFLPLFAVQGNYLGAVLDYKVEKNLIWKYDFVQFFVLNALVLILLVVIGNPQTFILKILSTLLFIFNLVAYELRENKRFVDKFVKKALIFGFIILAVLGIWWKP